MTYDVGGCEVVIEGRTAAVTCIFGENVAEPVLGVTALEQLFLAVDPVREQLIPLRVFRRLF